MGCKFILKTGLQCSGASSIANFCIAHYWAEYHEVPKKSNPTRIRELNEYGKFKTRWNI